MLLKITGLKTKLRFTTESVCNEGDGFTTLTAFSVNFSEVVVMFKRKSFIEIVSKTTFKQFKTVPFTLNI